MSHLALLVLLAGTAADGSQCLSYGRATIEGVLSAEEFPGPPNYESVQRGDRAEKCFFVSPATPICVEESKDQDQERESNVTRVQIAINRKGGFPVLERLVGRRVSCSGELFHAHTGHHHARVLMLGMCQAAQP